MYGTGFQSWAFLVSLQMACCLLKHWAEGKTGCDVATDFVSCFLFVSFMIAWLLCCFEGPLAPPATEMRCQKNVLP